MAEKEKPRPIPRLNQCLLCKGWFLEKDLELIEVPDQVGYIKKLACKMCLDEIINCNPISSE